MKRTTKTGRAPGYTDQKEPNPTYLVGGQAKVLKMILKLLVAYVEYDLRLDDYKNFRETLDAAKAVLGMKKEEPKYKFVNCQGCQISMEVPVVMTKPFICFSCEGKNE